uniref:Uncharacterized protein n=1 Tax=Knipowitschia caucasica TaxID=637954 RepID=A0AAV2KLH1_KNICA
MGGCHEEGEATEESHEQGGATSGYRRVPIKVYSLGSEVAAGGLPFVLSSEDVLPLRHTAKRPTRSGGAHTPPAQ